MSKPQGTLTAVQYEIMNVVWDAGDAGVAVAGIWQAIASSRQVGRTTVLNLVDRLEKRGWLRRHAAGSSYRYTAAVPRQQTEAVMAAGFVDEFFGGSAPHLVQSLLGGRGLSSQEISRLRKLIEDAKQSPAHKSRGGRP